MNPSDEAPVPLPDGLYLEVTNRCNLRCRSCLQYRGMKEGPKDLSLDEVRRIGEQIPGTRRVVLHGVGEPLLNEELAPIIHYWKDRRAYLLFNTNALLLNRGWAERLIQAGLDELRVSLDAATEQTYARIRGARRFNRVVENVAALVRARQAARRRNPKVSLWMVGTRENVGDLPEMIRLASRIGIDEVYLQRLVYPTDGAGYGLASRQKSVTDPAERIFDLLRESVALSRQLDVPLRASGLGPPAESLRSRSKEGAPWRRCQRPREVAYITAWGNVLPCCISPFATWNYEALILGNVFAEPFERIWTGSKFQEFRRKQQSLYPPDWCIGCGVDWSL